MSQDAILLDLGAVKQRNNLFKGTFPKEKNIPLFSFDNTVPAQTNLANLAQTILHSNSIPASLYSYQPIFLEIISYWTSKLSHNDSVNVLEASALIISMYPLSMSLTEDFLDRENEHFITILQNPSTQPESDIRSILLSYHRLLFHNKEVFSKYIRPDLLYNIISNQDYKFSDDIVKYLAIKVVSAYLNMGEQAVHDMIKANITRENTLIGAYNNDTAVDYHFLEVNEAKRISNFSKLPAAQDCLVLDESRSYFIMRPEDLTERVVSICGILVPKIDTSNAESKSENSYVPTEKTIEVLRKLAKLVQKSAPIMVVGKAGAGKTFAINEISKYMGCEKSIVKIHLGEQTDAKLLIGTYTSGEKPGTFEWRSGVLTTAVQEGRWVLIEDIDKAPTEVLSILLSLLEKRELTIPSRGETIKAANGFQLISTVRMSNEDARKVEEGENFNMNLIGMRIWNTVYMEDISQDDLNKILCNKYPVLTRLIPRLIKTYESVQNIYNNPKFISLNRGAHARGTSTRDLVKLCERLDTLFSSNNITQPDQLIESSIYDSIFSESVDCFASSIGELKAMEPIIHVIGETLEISLSRISLFMNKHVPNFEDFDDHIDIGRTSLEKSRNALLKKSVNSTSFALTNHSLRLMEQIAVSVKMTEPVLLVGETGTGKTTVVQQLSKRLNKTLTVINVSQQTETGDLLGGYKPVNSKTIAVPVQELFESLFASTFSMKKNEKFYKILHKCFNKGQWKNVVRLWNEAFKMAQSILKQDDTSEKDDPSRKKKRKLGSHDKKMLLEQWTDFMEDVKKFEAQSSSINNSFVFDFVEGSLVKAVRNGEWLLLDEINLASADTLESISDLLSEAATRSILLSEKGDIEPVQAHPDFRIFACMNPATDVGKRDLPSGIRSKFTEIYVQSPDRDITDLLSIIDKYIGKFSVSDEWVGNDIAELYLEAKKLSENNRIVDGSNQRPHFSIRTLTRTLLYVCDIVQIYGLRRSLYDGFCMSFLTLLDQKSAEILEPLIKQHILGRMNNIKQLLTRAPPAPGNDYINFNHYWMKKGNEEPKEHVNYIITPFVEKNMMNLVRATSSRRFPVLIQGPTSAGKTSMIKYLADITGHKFVRINNHEHTDLQEYLGTYIADDTGKLAFKEGVLIEALRKGYWIVLDELNLAPTDVLEALNRLLDDNRELFIPETQEVVHPHPDFMLFATQNPPGVYGGRKVLSRAFRNRFLELHFDDIPQDELEIILRERCQIAPSYAKKIVEVYRQLSIERSASRLFEQKNSFATLRDLFRWALREAVGYEELAANGYMLLAERCRNPQEKVVIKKILEKVMKVQLDMNQYYEALENKDLENEHSVVWTGALRRLAVLVSTCLKNNEPILLVGETGCGKTTICQILSSYMNKELIMLNAHQNTETGDILGAQRPVRNRSELQGKLSTLLEEILQTSNDDLDQLLKLYDESDNSNIIPEKIAEVKRLRDKLGILFEWNDGPLIHALKTANFFLLDEISLADDSVLERLNSVLEPERSILLAEKGVTDNFVVAQEGFQFFATMNPGGDYGKKELSPALRNRFTEIWVPSMEDFNDVNMIISSRLNNDIKVLTDPITKFSEWFGKKFGGGNATNGVISLRDILSWVEFINSSYKTIKDEYMLLTQGAAMVFVDALGTNNTAYLAEDEDSLKDLKLQCIDQLGKFARKELNQYLTDDYQVSISDTSLKIGPFERKRENTTAEAPSFNLSAPTTAMNLMRVIRAMQVHKPILLEGSPGVGKTSLITALATITGNNLTRINLSEQTDLVDLFGSDTPGEKSGEFVWRDAPFLRAMQNGEWVLLDEMNLASQSVLEGLNACLDHRGEAYVPELDRSFVCHPNFIVFAAQNPQYQGGGRKGLPKSFVNRFSVVYVDMLNMEDLSLIASYLYPKVPKDITEGLITVMSNLETEISKERKWASQGAPWEFNLRDALRWLKLLSQMSISGQPDVFDFINTIIIQRFRTPEDRLRARQLVESIFGPYQEKDNFAKVTRNYVQMNSEVTKRNAIFSNPVSQHLNILHCNITIYETVLRCINKNWPLILVGPTNAGKTDIIRYIAGVVGADLHVFSMNSDVDSMDILGGYEQVDLVRKISYITNDLKIALRKLLCVNLRIGNENSNKSLLGLELLKYISSETITIPEFEILKHKFTKLMSFLQDDQEFNDISLRIEHLAEILGQEQTVNFEWFDGMLVRAVEQGHWLVLDNANLCSPSVLDRLNSLLETDGSLLINECSQKNGEPRVLKPHKNFRLFITMNPKYGELSRAMRNRGIEIYIDDLNDRASTWDKSVLSDAADLDKPHDSVKMEVSAVIGDLGNLRLSDKESFDSLQKYIPIQASELLIFAEFEDILSTMNVNIDIDMLSTIIPLNELFNVKAWAQNVQNNHSFETYSYFKQVNNFLAFLEQNNILSKLNDIEKLAEENIYQILQQSPSDISSQALLPTLNVYALPVLKERLENIDSSESLFLFSCLGGLMRISEKLQKANQRSLNAKIDELNYLELSAAVFNGRQIRNPPRIQLFSLLVNIVNFVMEEITRENILLHQHTYKLYMKLIILIDSTMSCAQNKDEARLRVYEECLQKWADEATLAGLDVERFIEICSSLKNSLMLTSGQSIVPLWETFRKQYPSTLSSWTSWNELMAMCTKFDEVKHQQFGESYESIRNLTTMIAVLSQEIVNNETPTMLDLIPKLEEGIQSLESISSKFLIRRKHFFKEEFDTLMRILFADGYEQKNTISDLAPFTSITTEKLVKLSNENYVFPPIFDMLWIANDGIYHSFTTELFSSTYFENIIRKSNMFMSSTGSQIEQSLFDAKKLMSSTIQMSKLILQEPFEKSANTLEQWILDIIQVHTKTDIRSIKPEDFAACIASESPSSFQIVFTKYLHPALTLSKESPSKLGKAWILFGICCVEIFAPNLPIDPAINDYVQFQVFAKHREFSDTVLSTWRDIRQMTNGDKKLHIEEHIDIISDEDAPKKPQVYRPASPVDNLFEEWLRFLESTVSTEQADELTTLLQGTSQNAIDRLELFHQNTSNFMKRLATGYTYFTDLNDIFSGYIMTMKFGFDILQYSENESRKTQQLSSLWPVTPTYLVSPPKVADAFTTVEGLINSWSVDDVNSERILIFFLRVIKIHDLQGDMLVTLDKALQLLYYRWSVRRIKEEQKQQEDSKLFKYEDQEDDIDAEIKKMFPDYDNEFEDETHSLTNANMDITESYYLIAKLYVDIFNNKPAEALTDLVYDGSKVVDIMVRESKKLQNHIPNGDQLTGTLLSLNKNIKSFDKTEEVTSFNFYQESSMEESRRAIAIVSSVWSSVNKLIIQWPEHATLQELSRICREFLEYPTETPLAKQLQKIEQLYAVSVEWDKYAASHVSLATHITSLTDLIVSWRRMELRTWNELFNTEDENVRNNIGKWWFYLFETIVVAQKDIVNDQPSENSYTDIIMSLNTFFSKSTLGEYSDRLHLVHAFTRHVEILGLSNDLVGALTNTLSFYDQFRETIETQIKTGKKSLEKDMKEVILLASWKDVNVDALKQSSRKSHNSLFKIVRKYRAILSTPCLPLIENGLPYVPNAATSFTSLGNVYPEIHVDMETNNQKVQTVPGWSSRSKVLQNVGVVTTNMEKYISTIKAQELPNFVDFVKDYAREADRLKEETPGVYKKEIKKLLAALKVQKGKLFSDALKELRRSGLKTRFREDIHKVQGNATSIIANSVPLTNDNLKSCDSYYFRIIDLLPRLRNAVASPSDDIPAVAIEKGMAVVENLVFSLITTRRPVSKLSDNYANIKDLQDKMVSICTSQGSICEVSMKFDFSLMKHFIKRMPMVLEYCSKALSMDTSGTTSNADILFINESKLRLMSFATRLEKITVLDSRGSTLISEFKNYISNLIRSANDNKTDKNFFIYDVLLNWISENQVAQEVPKLTEEMALQEVDQSLRKLYTSIILAFQKVMENNFDSISEEDDGWLSNSVKQTVTLGKTTYSQTVIKNLTAVILKFESSDFSIASSSLVRAMVAFTMPVINNYVALMKYILEISRTQYSEISRGTYILSNILLNLAKNGFCSPQPPSEETEDNNLHEGTGLGDGEGAQNNSNDIEQDEDLTEDAQQDNKDQKDKDEREDDEDDDAVDMEGDMAGQMEEISDQEDDQDDQDMDEEEEDLDEEIDNLDQDDPNAIDDKMWDEKPDEDTKEKNSDQTLDNKDDNNDVEANEDEGDNQNDNSNDANEQEGQQEESKQEESKNPEDVPDNEQDENASEDGSDEEDVGEQDDEVKNEEGQDMDDHVPEVETMDLPEDINLDSGEENNEESEGEEGEPGFESEEEEEDVDMDKDDSNKDMNIEEDEDAEEENQDEDVDNAEIEQDETELPEDELQNNDDANKSQEEGEISDEENLGEDQQENTDDNPEDAENGMSNDVEGLDGLDDQSDTENINDEAAVQEQSGSKGAGADSKDTEEQEDIGNFGATNNAHEEQDAQNESTEASREEAKESLKQLGDALKEFHRRKQDINDKSERDEEEDSNKPSANERPDEFEHVDGANTENDTQALGSATQEQLQSIDEDMAIDDDMSDNNSSDNDEQLGEDEDMLLDETVKHEELDDLDMTQGKQHADDEENEFNQRIFTENDKSKKEDDNNEDMFNEKNLLDSQKYNDEIDEIIESMDRQTKLENLDDEPKRSIENARELWQRSERATSDLVSRLGEQLRLILEPTLATKLRGDYKTGKRLNMKRIIPYIASQFRKDKIWLRRTKPSKRQYQIMVALDNSKSMSESNCVKLAFDSLCLVSRTLTQLESGGLSIVKFGETSKEVHSFDQQFSTETGAKVFQWFDFQDTKTDVKKLVAESLKIFERGRAITNSDQWQLEIIISDGVCEDHDTIERLVRRAREKKIMLVFVIIDGIGSNESIMDMSQVNYVPDKNGNPQLKITKYLDSFPFEFYVVVHEISELPEMLSLILRQYFSDLASS